MTLEDLDEPSMAALIELGGKCPTGITSLDVWLLGGAIGDVPAGDTPVSHRNAAYLIGLEANWDNPEEDEACKAWAREGTPESLDRTAPGAGPGACLCLV